MTEEGRRRLSSRTNTKFVGMGNTDMNSRGLLVGTQGKLQEGGECDINAMYSRMRREEK